MERKKKGSRKNHQGSGEKQDLDRLSSLPDSILTHIFSFLDLESVIRASVLSTRYKLLWTLSQCLDFRLPESLSKKRCANAFESYVTHVLQFREHSNLVKFRLSLHKDVRMDFAENCVRYAADHKVQHFRMLGWFDVKRQLMALPKSLLNSPTLISLNLRNATANSIELPKSLSLPNLKLLCLKNFEFSDKNYNGELLLGCPSLETLFLYKCSIKPVNKIKAFDVSCSNLRHLEIRHWRSPWRCFDEHTINVNAPKLALFQFRGHLARVNFKEVLPCLETACFDLNCPIACCTINCKERLRKTSKCFLSMLFSICNVKVISLSLKTIEIVCCLRNLRARAPVVFENLRIIKFTYANASGEETIKNKTARRLLNKIRVKAWPLEIYKVKEALSEEKSWLKPIPSHFIHFLLKSSPAAELLTVDINLSGKE